MNFADLFKVSIEFDRSHLVFPRIIHWLILILFIVILVVQGIPYLREVRSGKKSLPFTTGSFDALRLFGTIVLTVMYFVSMDFVGQRFPNKGFGFLFMSIPYMLLLSVMYLRERNHRQLLLSVVCAFIAPIIAWYVLAKLFGITLP